MKTKTVMDTETTEGAVVDTTNDTGEGEPQADTISIPKSDYEKMNQTLGSLKRELKDLKKPKDEPKEDTSKTNAKPDENRLLAELEEMALDNANISHIDDVELAKSTAKKWGVSLRNVLKDEDFKVKLARQQTGRDNLAATSRIKGGAGSSQAKNTPEYWIAKGAAPTPTDIPNLKDRAKVVRALMANEKSSKKFYND